MTRVQKLVPVFVLVVILGSVGYAMIPFNFAGAVDCEAPLFGADPKSTRAVGLVIPAEDCRDKGKSRLLVSAFTALTAAAVGTATLALKPISQQCLTGNHEGCPDWWQDMVGSTGYEHGFGCQCSCHG